MENNYNNMMNLLTPVHTLKNLCQILVTSDADSPEAVQAFNYLSKTSLFKTVEESIEKLIELAKKMDLTINDSPINIDKQV